MISIFLHILSDPRSITAPQLTNIIGLLTAAAALWYLSKKAKEGADAEGDAYYQERVRELAAERTKVEREKAEEARVRVVR